MCFGGVRNAVNTIEVRFGPQCTYCGWIPSGTGRLTPDHSSGGVTISTGAPDGLRPAISSRLPGTAVPTSDIALASAELNGCGWIQSKYCISQLVSGIITLGSEPSTLTEQRQ